MNQPHDPTQPYAPLPAQGSLTNIFLDISIIHDNILLQQLKEGEDLFNQDDEEHAASDAVGYC